MHVSACGCEYQCRHPQKPEALDPWRWIVSWSVWVLRAKCWSSGRETNTPDYWVILPALKWLCGWSVLYRSRTETRGTSPANLHIWRAPESPHSISTSHQAPCRDVGQQVYGRDQDFHILGWCPTGRALTWHVSSPELIPQHHTNRKDSGAHLVSTLSRLGQRTGGTRSSATVGDSGPGKHKQKRFSPVGNFQLPGQEPTLRKPLSWNSHFSHTAIFKPPRPTKPSSGPHVWFYG